MFKKIMESTDDTKRSQILVFSSLSPLTQIQTELYIRINNVFGAGNNIAVSFFLSLSFKIILFTFIGG